MKISDLGLKIRTESALKQLRITEVEELLKCTPRELCSHLGFGYYSLKDLREKLLNHNLCLAGDTIVSSSHAIELVRDIPLKLDKLTAELQKILFDVKDLMSLVDKIRVASESR